MKIDVAVQEITADGIDVVSEALRNIAVTALVAVGARCTRRATCLTA